MSMRGKITIQKIADTTGVSKYAVSRALAGKSGVSEQTREMILKAAGQLGYFNHDSFRASAAQEQPEYLYTKKTGTIVVLFPNIRYQNKESLYWGPVSEGITSRLNELGMDIITLTEPTSDHVFKVLNPDAILGIITVGSISTSILLDIHRLRIPLVMVDHLEPGYHCDTIFSDNMLCMREIMTRLIHKGYSSFQFVGNIQDAYSFYERWLAYSAALEYYNLERNQIPELIGPDVEHVHQVIAELDEKRIPEVFVCANDMTALFAIEALKARNIQVPAHCAVTGFDHTYDNLPLFATVDVNKEVLGHRAVDQMMWRIANPNASYEKKQLYADILYKEQNAMPIRTVQLG